MSVKTLKGDDRLPIYQRLADTLMMEITNGQRRPGDRVPSENGLAEDYGISTGTARQAVAELVDRKVLERFHGKGTFVRRPNFDQSLFRFFRFRSNTGEAIIPQSRILKRTIEPAPSYVATRLEIEEGAEAINMSRLRLVDNEPLLAEEIWLPVTLFREFFDMPAEDIGNLLYPIYDNACNQLIAQAEEDLTVEMASPEIRRLLRLNEPTPLIVLERLAKSYSGQPLEWRRSRGTAEQFRYKTQIR